MRLKIECVVSAVARARKATIRLDTFYRNKMSCKWSPKPDDYRYDACEEYDFLFNDESDNETQYATLFQPNDGCSDQVERSPMRNTDSEIGFLLRQTGISTEYKDYKLSSNRTGIDLLGNNPFTVTGFPNHPLPFDFFKLNDCEELSLPNKNNVKETVNRDSTNANSTCLVVNLPEESALQDVDDAVGLCDGFVTATTDEDSKKKKKKGNKESLPESSKQKTKKLATKKSKKTRWTAIQIPEVDIFAGRPNLLQSLRPA